MIDREEVPPHCLGFYHCPQGQWFFLAQEITEFKILYIIEITINIH